MHVLIISQSDINRMGMKSIIQQMCTDCILTEAETIKEGIILTDNIYPDLIIIYLDGSATGGIGVLDELKNSRMTRNIVLISSSENYALEYLALEKGISAFLCGQTKKEIITAVLQIVIAGGRYFSPDLMLSCKEGNFKKESAKLIVPLKRFNLTNRQGEVLELLAEGRSNKAIANELNIASGTVKIHIAGILKSLNAQNRTQAVATARRFNLI